MIVFFASTTSGRPRSSPSQAPTTALYGATTATAAAASASTVESVRRTTSRRSRRLRRSTAAIRSSSVAGSPFPFAICSVLLPALDGRCLARRRHSTKGPDLPQAGARDTSALMVDLYYWPTPNGWKISIMLEECGLPYTVKPVNIGRGEQFAPEFLKISPNNRMPAIVDHDPPGGGEAIAIFESAAILQYLPHTPGNFIPP